MSYKLKSEGLPEPLFVHAAGTSIICNSCGNYDKNNRLNQADFKCTSCGHSENADIQASKNIAMKRFWLETEYSKKNNKMNMTFKDWLALT